MKGAAGCLEEEALQQEWTGHRRGHSYENDQNTSHETVKESEDKLIHSNFKRMQELSEFNLQ